LLMRPKTKKEPTIRLRSSGRPSSSASSKQVRERAGRASVRVCVRAWVFPWKAGFVQLGGLCERKMGGREGGQTDRVREEVVGLRRLGASLAARRRRPRPPGRRRRRHRWAGSGAGRKPASGPRRRRRRRRPVAERGGEGPSDGPLDAYGSLERGGKPRGREGGRGRARRSPEGPPRPGRAGETTTNARSSSSDAMALCTRRADRSVRPSVDGCRQAFHPVPRPTPDATGGWLAGDRGSSDERG